MKILRGVKKLRTVCTVRYRYPFPIYGVFFFLNNSTILRRFSSKFQQSKAKQINLLVMKIIFSSEIVLFFFMDSASLVHFCAKSEKI